MAFRVVSDEMDMAPVASRHDISCKLPNVEIVVVFVTIALYNYRVSCIVPYIVAPYDCGFLRLSWFY